MKKIVFLFLILIIFLTGCASFTTKLETPVIIAVEDNVVYWGHVSNADSYLICIDGIYEKKTSDVKYNLGDFLKESKNGVVKVKAKGNGFMYSDSDWSEDCNYEFFIKSNSNITNATVEKYKKYNLGSGIDVIHGTYLDLESDDTIKSNYFIDISKLAKLYPNIKSDVPGKGEWETISADSVEKYIDQVRVNASYYKSVEGGAQVKVVEFGGKLSTEFQFSAEWKRTVDTHEFYSKSTLRHASDKKSIEDFGIGTYKEEDLINDKALVILDDLMKLEGKSLDEGIEDLFKTFGTHIITSAIYGGKVEVLYHCISEDYNESLDLAGKINAELNTKFSYLGNGGETEQKGELELEYNTSSETSDTKFVFNVNSYGGTAMKTWKYENFSEGFYSWIDSYEKSDKITMIDIEQMVPIWEILPQKYFKLAKEMERVYNNKLSKVSNDFFAKFSYNALGTESNPIPIKTREEFYDYMSKDTTDRYFRLEEDIKIGQPLSVPVFNGILDGNGHKIYGMYYTVSQDKYNEKKYKGLFDVNKGTIKNLTIENFDIKGEVQHDGEYLYAGFVCGKNEGLIEKVNVSSSWLNINRTGSSIGGIAGINYGRIKNCNLNDLLFFTNGDCGGVSGVNASGANIENCNFIGKTNDYSFQYWYIEFKPNSQGRSIGGIVGFNQENATVETCTVKLSDFLLTGDMAVHHKSRAGYLIGENIGYLINSNYENCNYSLESKYKNSFKIMHEHIFSIDNKKVGKGNQSK